MNEQIKELKLTELESKTLDAFVNQLYAEPGYSSTDVGELASITKIKINSIRGVISSLIKKGIIFVAEVGVEHPIVYLKKEFWYLHSQEWKEEAELY